MEQPLVIDYYSDVLCIWAWISQRRIDELSRELQGQIEIRYFCVDVFGDVPTKMDMQWRAKGGFEGFAEHVQESAARYEHAYVNPRCWSEIRPNTSANPHLMIKAVENVHHRGFDMALAIRKAFFVDARDIGRLDVLLELAEAENFDRDAVNASLNDGTAMASLMHDLQAARQQSIKGSPSYVVDGGRQTLYGNVGYRVLLANVEELLRKPPNEASWC